MEPKDRRATAQALGQAIVGFYRRGWCLGTSGNFSARLQRDPFQLLVTRSGLDKGLVAAEDWIAVGSDAKPLPGETGKPSAETFLHVAVAQQMGAGSVMHTHSPAGTLVSEHYRPRGGVRLRGYEILKGLRSIDTHEAEILIPIVENSQNMEVLYEQVPPLIRPEGPPAFLIAGHGLYTWGETVGEAKRHVETLEFLLECVARRTPFAPIDP